MYFILTLSQWHLGVHDLTSNRKWKYSCMLEIKMHHKTKVDQQHRFFLRIFFPTHFDHWKPKYRSWHYCILWILGTCLHEKSWSTFFWCSTHLLNIMYHVHVSFQFLLHLFAMPPFISETETAMMVLVFLCEGSK